MPNPSTRSILRFSQEENIVPTGAATTVTDPHGETDLAGTRPEVLAPMRSALERWMDQGVESSIAEIFPGGEP